MSGILFSTMSSQDALDLLHGLLDGGEAIERCQKGSMSHRCHRRADLTFDLPHETIVVNCESSDPLLPF